MNIEFMALCVLYGFSLWLFQKQHSDLLQERKGLVDRIQAKDLSEYKRYEAPTDSRQPEPKAERERLIQI